MAESFPSRDWEGRKRTHPSGSEDVRVRKDGYSRRRSPEKHRPFRGNDLKSEEDSRVESDHLKKRRSRSPRDERPEMRRRYSSDSGSPDRRRRSRRDIPKHIKSDRSVSNSPRRKRKLSKSRNGHQYSAQRDSHSLTVPSNFSPSKRSQAPLPSQKEAYGKEAISDAVMRPAPEIEKLRPNFAPTGKLAAETNTVANTSIVLKYNEPPEARLPPQSSPWRLYIFKGSGLLETLPLYERSCWLFGRERAVVDFATEHPSCSKQHAVLQFRYTEKKNEWGEKKGAVKPYVIDLESANGTKVNGERVPESRYLGLVSGDVITFGDSSREYVLILPPKEEKKP